MTDFRPECIINLHVEIRGKPGRISWACSITREKHGRVVLARKLLGEGLREEAELAALEFGFAQANRFQQEKVEVTATFPLESTLEGSGRKLSPGLKPRREAVLKAWMGFRLRKLGRMEGPEALALREAAEKAFVRR
jgi:hypothetical protein